MTTGLLAGITVLDFTAALRGTVLQPHHGRHGRRGDQDRTAGGRPGRAVHTGVAAHAERRAVSAPQRREEEPVR